MAEIPLCAAEFELYFFDIPLMFMSKHFGVNFPRQILHQGGIRRKCLF